MKLLAWGDSNALDRHLTAVFDAIPCAGALGRLWDPIRSYALAGGKRMRPQLCAWTYRQTQPDDVSSPTNPSDLPSGLLDLACAWELFHAFLLIHDDLIDAADFRRDRRSLHRELQSLDHDSEQFGRSLAIVAGDLLFSEAMRLFHDSDLPPDAYRDELRLFSRVARLTGFGQAIDICQSHAPLDELCEKTLLREYHWKTAAYTFEGPMLSGAIAAGAPADVRAVLSRFALSLGQAYQMQNDVADLSRPAHDGCDLVQGKRTITLLRYRQSLDAARRDQFDRRFTTIPSLNGHAVSEAEAIRNEMITSPAITETRQLIDQFLTDAASAATDAALPASLAEGLIELLDRLRASYFAVV